MRTKLALLAAVVLGFLAAIGVRHYIEQRDRELRGTAERVAIVVTREGIERGGILREHMIKPLEVEVKAVGAMNILFHQRSSWVGLPVARKIKADEPLTKNDFLGGVGDGPGTPGSSRIEPGWRAITLPADQISGVAGLITPTSRVDILGTFREQTRGGSEATANIVTRVVARNVEVLAVDNRTELSVPVRTPGARAPQADRGYSSITLHVTALEASLLTFAQGAGKITFALRRSDDVATRDNIPEITQAQLIELIAAAARQREEFAKQLKAATPP